MPSFNISAALILKLYLTVSQTGTSAWLSWWVNPLPVAILIFVGRVNYLFQIIIDTITSRTGLEAEVKFNRNCIGLAVTMRVAVVSWKGIYVWSYLRA